MNEEEDICEKELREITNTKNMEDWMNRIGNLKCPHKCSQLEKINNTEKSSNRKYAISLMAKKYDCKGQILCNGLSSAKRLNRGCDPECSDKLKEYITTRNKSILKVSDNCPWYKDIANQVLEDVKEGEEYDAQHDMGYLYSIYLAIKYQQCSISHLDSSKNITYFSYTEGSHVKFPKIILENLNKCSRRFVLVPIIISNIHYNAGIFDLGKNPITFERFEPYGYDTELFKTKQLDEELKIILAKCSIVYIPPIDFCPSIGPQALEEIEQSLYSIRSKYSFVGFCQAWGSWYYEKRLENPDKPIRDLIKDEIEKLNTATGEANFIKYIVNFTVYMTKLYETVIEDHIKSDDITESDTINWIANNFNIISDAVKEYINNNIITDYTIQKEKIITQELDMITI